MALEEADAEAGPVVRALLALEAIQDVPGITAAALGERLGVTDRAARRYVRTLRDAGIPVESEPGRYGGYRLGRSYRLPPLMFSTAEALGLVMTVIAVRPEGVTDDPVEAALGKLLRVLPRSMSTSAAAVRTVPRRVDPDLRLPDPEVTATLVRATHERLELELRYRASEQVRTMRVQPWSVVIRHGRWYLLCWSVDRSSRRLLRVDRISTAAARTRTFVPPADLRPLDAVEEHLSQSWTHEVEIVFTDTAERVRHWFPPAMGAVTEEPDGTTVLRGTTNETLWYAAVLAESGLPFTVRGGPEMRQAVRTILERLTAALAGGG